VQQGRNKEDGNMERVKQVAGGIVFGVLTAAVGMSAIYALWLGAPLLNPGNGRFSASDIPTINTDAKIVRPIPPAQVSPRSGVVQPAPSTAKPKTMTVSRRSPAKRQTTSASTGSAASSKRSSARRPVVATSHDSHDAASEVAVRSDRSSEAEPAKSSETEIQTD
jgi:hypothetical protein